MTWINILRLHKKVQGLKKVSFQKVSFFTHLYVQRCNIKL